MHPWGIAPYGIHRRPAIFALVLGPSGDPGYSIPALRCLVDVKENLVG